jgi:hypothetical protein
MDALHTGRSPHSGPRQLSRPLARSSPGYSAGAAVLSAPSMRPDGGVLVLG